MSNVSTFMGKIAAAMFVVALAGGIAGCGAGGASTSGSTASGSSSSTKTAEQAEPTSVTIQGYNANKELVDVEVPYNPARVAVLDMAALDILDSLGVGDRVVGSASTSLEYLQDYATSEEVANLGTIKEADLEAVMACNPDVIFIGGRLASVYDDLSQIAPVVFLSTDTEKGVVESVRDNATAIASLFGLEDKVDGLMDDFDARIEALAKAANGSTALVTLFTSGSVNMLGTDGRCSLISNEIGFTNIAADEVTATHGNEVSFETIVEKDPEYIFVLNRDAAIGSDGADQAQEVVENDLTRQTQAYRNGHIVYLSNPAVWYTAEGGIEALNIMLEDLEGVLL